MALVFYIIDLIVISAVHKMTIQGQVISIFRNLLRSTVYKLMMPLCFDQLNK